MGICFRDRNVQELVVMVGNIMNILKPLMINF